MGWMAPRPDSTEDGVQGFEEAFAMQITTIGVDLAKHVFQLHGIGPDGRVVLRQKLRRSQMMMFFAKLPPCLIGMEACATAPDAGALRQGIHQTR